MTDDELAEIARAHGVAVSYVDGAGQERPVAPDVVEEVLGLLDVDVSTPAARRTARAAAREKAALPATIGTRTDRARPLPGPGVLVAEDGARRDVDGELPAGLEPGRYALETGGRQVTVVVGPGHLPDPPRTWGWMLQLYALHSARSWGIGDLGDLTDLVRVTGREHGAGAVLLNPLHAVTPVPPVQPSPYTPSSRRFVTPLALRVTDLPAYACADAATRAEVDALRPEQAGDRIAHDRVWAAKRSALEALWRAQGRPGPRDPEPGLEEFATFCALAERHGGRWSLWPSELRRPDSDAVAAARAELAPRVAFHGWVQQQASAQLAAVRTAAREAGMPVGVIHDLAVGCDPEGADAWAWADTLALNASVGAPPDAFNQRGQTWGLPPWRPDRLADTGYAAFAEMVRALLGHADGLRIDHVMGLWRLWWVPAGRTADRGTYVHYDADAMLATLTLEAYRAGALIVGEDLGTVLPEVREEMRRSHLHGSTVLWFSRDPDPETGGDDGPLQPPGRWPEHAVATISTHDLPTAPGFLRAEHVRVREELGLLDDPAAERARAAAERTELVALLVHEGHLSTPDASEDEIVVAMHALLASAPSRLALASLYDVLGETRQPNLPGTVDEYPNWRLPLPVGLERALSDPRVARVAAAMREQGRAPAPGDDLAGSPAMTTNDPDLAAVDLVRADGTAGALWQAWTTGERLESLPELVRPRTPAEGFAAQQRLAERAGPAYGWKLAATAAAGQAHIGVDAPLPGLLFERFRHAPGDVLPSADLHMAVAEAEFAFVMGSPVGPDAGPDELRAAVAAVHCAIEFPESRFADFVTAGGPQLLADAACAGRFVLGPEIDGGADLDLSTTGTALWIDGERVATGDGSAVLGDPWTALAWLARELPSYGVPLEAGSIVTTGTTTVPVPIAAGNVVRATFGDDGALGELTVTLAGTREDRA